MNNEHTYTESLRSTPRCPKCGFLAPTDYDTRSLGEWGYCADCRCEVVARDNDDGDVPAELAALGVSCFEFEKEVAMWTAFRGRTRAQAVTLAIAVLSDGREPSPPAAPLAVVPAIVPVPAEIAELHVHAEGDCSCTATTVCRPCIIAHYAAQGTKWHAGYDRTVASLTPAELAAWHKRIRRDIDDAQLAYDEEFPAVCDARVQAVIDHQTDRYLAGEDVADALAEMSALRAERLADDRRAHALFDVAI